MADHQDEAVTLRDLYRFLTLAGGRRNRFLDKYMFTCKKTGLEREGAGEFLRSEPVCV
jgi:hypothetical protein